MKQFDREMLARHEELLQKRTHTTKELIALVQWFSRVGAAELNNATVAMLIPEAQEVMVQGLKKCKQMWEHTRDADVPLYCELQKDAGAAYVVEALRHEEELSEMEEEAALQDPQPQPVPKPFRGLMVRESPIS